ncbi:ATP-binding protein [Fictibacillus enclensis]|uniref:sensor histidine kinase n=1 Tax=Fictibacillus enclensis TaxID=1017270 RepID=UPI0025A03CA4|nr:ATP-binding protein [Fictibacillus enclensis]MDM5339911.1 ATP-binding protein [Fictibacillus enclensis]
MKIKTKIQLLSTVWLFIMILFINSCIYFMFYKLSTESERDRLTRQTEIIAQAVKPHMASKADAVDLLRAYIPSNGMIRIISGSNKAVLVIEKDNHQLTDLRSRFTSSQSADIFKNDGKLSVRSTIPLIWSDGNIVTLEVVEGLSLVEENLYTLRWVLVAASLAILLPSIASGRILGNLILKPIGTMVKTMKEAHKERSYKKIPLAHRSKDELYTMAVTYNHLMDQLQENYEKQQQFVSDASHELKTPLTIIQSYAQLLKRRGLERPDLFQEAVDAIDAETVHMREMTQQLLKLAVSTADFQLPTEKIELNAFCGQSITSFSAIHSRDLQFHPFNEQQMIWANREGLKQILFILLDNAQKYSKEHIEVTVGSEGPSATIAIRDFGEGIPEKDLSHVTERFYRVDKARSRETGGNGLGLSIAQQMIHNMNGNMRIQSKEGEGTTVTLLLKKVEDSGIEERV